MSEGEVHERYLVSQYFNNPTVADLKNDMPAYLGMQDTAFKPKTIERGMKWKSADGRKWHAERGGTEAVFMKEGDIFVIITTYLGRRTK